jgi:hypothetical protein
VTSTDGKNAVNHHTLTTADSQTHGMMLLYIPNIVWAQTISLRDQLCVCGYEPFLDIYVTKISQNLLFFPWRDPLINCKFTTRDRRAFNQTKSFSTAHFQKVSNYGNGLTFQLKASISKRLGIEMEY